jgi:hypothetical protein
MSPPQAGARAARVGIAFGLAVALVGLTLVVWAYRIDRHWIDIHMTTHSCAEYPKELTRGRVVRWVGLISGALLLFAAPFAGRWARRRGPRELATRAVGVLAATFLALLVSDGVLRWRNKPGPPGLRVFHYEPDSEGDPRYVYRPIRSHVTGCRVGDKTLRFVIDANGYRVPSTDFEVGFTRPTILLTGESVASGFGLNYEETYPSMIAGRLGVQTINVAVQGYGSDGAYMRLSEELPRFEHLIATVTMVNHMMVDRNVWPDRPHLVIEEDGSRKNEPVKDTTGWLDRSPLLRLITDVYHSDEGVRRTRSYIEATAVESRARGAFPLFVLTNCGTRCMLDDTGAPSIEHTLFDGLDVEHVRVDIPDDYFDVSIGHPDRRAQALIADAIERALREHDLVAASR